jgi:hypothetical protein
MSLTSWRKHDKMSLNKGKSVSQLVKIYRTKYSKLDRDLLRRMIRVENKITNPSELKKLDRYLKKEFKNRVDRKESLEEKPLGRQLSKSERERLEELVQGRAEVKFAAQNFPSLQPLDDLLEIHKKMRKEAGLE